MLSKPERQTAQEDTKNKITWIYKRRPVIDIFIKFEAPKQRYYYYFRFVHIKGNVIIIIFIIIIFGCTHKLKYDLTF